jgi:hypothetical protein
MDNVSFEVKDGKLIITVDLAKEFGRSKSGKSITVASTRGNKPVMFENQQFMIGLNVYKKGEEK